MHIRECGVVQRAVRHQFLQHAARVRPGQVESCKIFAAVGKQHARTPAALRPPLQPLINCGSAGSGGGHVPRVGSKARRHAIIQHHAFVIAHQAVAHAAGGQLAPVVYIHALQQRRHAGAGQLNLAQRAHINQAHAFAHSAHLRLRVAVSFSAHPQPRQHHLRAMRCMPRLQRAVLHGLKMLAAKHAQRHRPRRRPRRGCAHARCRLAQRTGARLHYILRAHLPLARAHRRGAVALEQLGTVKALINRGQHILPRHILAKAHNIFSAAVDKGVRACWALRGGWLQWRRRCAQPQIGRCLFAGLLPFQQLCLQRVRAGHAPGGKDTRRQVHRQRCAVRTVKLHAPAHLAQQAVLRRPAHAHRHQVAIHKLARTGINRAGCGQRRNHRLAHAPVARGGSDGVLPVHRGCGGQCCQMFALAFSCSALVHNRCKADAGCMQVGGHLPAAVVGSYHQRALPGAHRKNLEQALRGTAKHDAGQVIVAKHQRRLAGTGGVHHRTHANL